jgi:N-methylhydantoinase A/oxoprolinase/acetone carboxylase beta subunit
MDGDVVVGTAKAATTADVTSGIRQALARVLDGSRVRHRDIDAVIIGTTHFTNAVVERRRLSEVACLRFGLPATRALPPLVTWPADIAEAVGDHVYLLHGGQEFDGAPISQLDELEVRRAASDIVRKGLRYAAVASVFSPIDGALERRAAEILREAAPNVQVTLSHEIGRLGLLERENAAILNASLQLLAHTTVSAFQRALDELNLAAPVYLTQNDGTLMDAAYCERYPVRTFASGPTNSMRGAAFLSGQREAVVIDIGGTTTDLGILHNGFPRESAAAVDVGGVRTNFRMPDVLSVALGGGSLVDMARGTLGPRSVGYELTERARVFGGDTLTATDLAVAAGLASIGNSGLVGDLDPIRVGQLLDAAEASVEEAVEIVKVVNRPMPAVVVGGGSLLLRRAPAGVEAMIKPVHFEVANAVGAAIAQVSGEVDQVFLLEGRTREEVLAEATALAIERAVRAGAALDSVEVIDTEDIPLAYLPGGATRVRVRVVGDLSRLERAVRA